MAVNVSYRVKYGYMVMLANDKKTWLKCDIHPANCLFATIYHYKQPNPQTQKLEKWSSLVNWFNDLKHLKRCFDPIDPIYSKSELKKVVLYTNLKDFEKIAKIIANCGFEVVIKPNPKEAKKKATK